MLVEMISERKKLFAAQRAAEQRSKPPTKTQIRNRMCAYLKNMEVEKSSKTRTEGSSKRLGDELESNKSKKQKIDEHAGAEKDDDQEEAEMKRHIEIVKVMLRIMDPNSSLGMICLGDDVIIISSDKAEGSGDWNSPEYQDTSVSKGKEAFDGEINLAFDENLISNEFAVKLCLDYEVRKGKRLSCGIVDFVNGVITIYPELDPFKDDSEKTGKSSDD
ncbi:hypothetical protein Tco_0779038 [Tanacetum coccineum]